MLGIILQFATQMTGVSAIQYYGPQIYEQVGFSSTSTLLIQSLNNVNALVGEAICIVFLDRVGRRIPLIWGNVLSGVVFGIST